MQQSNWRARESLLFQPVLKAYPTHHSWIITAQISLGNLEKTMMDACTADGKNATTTETPYNRNLWLQLI